MPATPPFAFPDRPFSVREVLSLTEKVSTFEHAAPMIGLAAIETGPNSDAHAVIGMYLGFGGGAHLSGFDPETNEWESVAMLQSHEITDPAVMGPKTNELMEWLIARYPDEGLVHYERTDPRRN